MKIQSIYYTATTNDRFKNYQNNNTPAFQGWYTNILHTRPRRNNNLFNDMCSDFSLKIGIPQRKIFGLLNNADKNRIGFFHKLANLYNCQNYYVKSAMKENPEHVIEVYNTVTKPTQEHMSILSRYEGDFEHLNQIFSSIRNKNDMRFVHDLQRKTLPPSKRASEVILELLRSPNAKLYAENLSDYTSYLKFNFENPDIVSNLDKLVQSGKFDKAFFDREYRISKLMKSSAIRKYLADYKQDLSSNLTPDSEHFIRKLCQDFLVHKDYRDSVKGEDIIPMYKSITSENFQVRRDLLEALKYHNDRQAPDKGYSEIVKLQALFEKMDNNKDVMEFIKNSTVKDLKFNSIDDLIDILNTVPTQKANIFFNNLKRIVRKTSGEERSIALKNELENPFYESKSNAFMRKQSLEYGFITPESKFSKFKRFFENKINMYKLKKQGAGEINSIDINTKISTKPKEHVIKLTEVPKSETVSTVKETTQPATLNLNRTVAATREAKRLVVINDVNNIIKTKLGQKTFERQEKDYAQNATKIRLKLLPEIFESIKDCRKVNKSSADNRDAIKLYSRIKGNNRKLIRYMLLKQNTDGTRMFTVRDIIKYIDDANKTIEKNKKLNKNYRAADAKAYYEELYQNLVQQNGKLKVTRVKKSGS